MQEIIVDEGKIKCLITGKMRKETPEEYVRQEYCRILLDVYKYPKSYIDVEYPIKVGSTDKRCDIVVFNDNEKSQDNIYWIVETKKKDETYFWIIIITTIVGACKRCIGTGIEWHSCREQHSDRGFCRWSKGL